MNFSITKILLTLLSLILLSVGCSFFLKDTNSLFRNWQTVQATILSNSLTEKTIISEVSNRRPSTTHIWDLDISYSYEFNGKKFVSNHPAPKIIRSHRIFSDGLASQELIALQGRFSVGNKVTAYINPNNSSEAYLVNYRTNKDMAIVWIEIGLGLIFGLIAINIRKIEEDVATRFRRVREAQVKV
jgi:hypothetical protein